MMDTLSMSSIGAAPARRAGKHIEIWACVGTTHQPD
jgi:hypothetical protein